MGITFPFSLIRSLARADVTMLPTLLHFRGVRLSCLFDSTSLSRWRLELLRFTDAPGYARPSPRRGSSNVSRQNQARDCRAIALLGSVWRSTRRSCRSKIGPLQGGLLRRFVETTTVGPPFY